MVLAAMVAMASGARSIDSLRIGQVFRAQLASADWRRIAFAIACIYVAYVFRAVRWSLLMRHNKKVPLFSLLGTQVIGFTAVALIGRFADPVRPYLVAKKTGEPLGSQIAVYIVERLFDSAPWRSSSRSLCCGSLSRHWPHRPGIRDSSATSLRRSSNAFPFSPCLCPLWRAAVTVVGVLVLVAVRLAGGAVARFFEQSFGLISKSLGARRRRKVRAFHAGLDIMRSFADFGYSASLSLGMWVLITLAYWRAVRAYTASPAAGRDDSAQVRSAPDDQRRRQRLPASRFWAGFPKSPLWPRRCPAFSALLPRPPLPVRRPFCWPRFSASFQWD